LKAEVGLYLIYLIRAARACQTETRISLKSHQKKKTIKSLFLLLHELRIKNS